LEEEYRNWQRGRAEKYDDDDEHAGTKRAAPKSSSSSAPKKVKSEAGDTDDVLDDGEMKKLVKKNTVNKLTIPKLKSWLHEKGEKGISTMKKADLVSLVEQHFESVMDVDG